MLFAPDELQRHHVRERGGLDGLPRKTRFPPIRHGKLTLVRIDLDKDADGQPKIHKPRVVSSISFKCTIVEGQQEGRWFHDRFVLGGFKPGKERTRENLIAMLMCLERAPTEVRLGRIDGLVFPVMICREEHWKTGRTQNVIHAMNPHPDHPDFDGYHDIVKRVMAPDDNGKFAVEVPGWSLYPESKSCKLVQRRLADRLEKMPSGVTRLQERRLRTVERIEDRFCQAAA